MRSRTADRLCAEAVDLARTAAEEVAGKQVVGGHLGAVAEGDRVVTHSFACHDPAYRGWRWAVTVARASRSRLVTVDESVLLPEDEALLAPEWVPWSERLRPGDLGPGDLLPTEADDPRLEPGWLAAEEEPEPEESAEPPAGPAAAPPAHPVPLTGPAGGPAAGADTVSGPPRGSAPAGAPDAAAVAGEPAVDGLAAPAGAFGAPEFRLPATATSAALAEQLGLRRARVLSRFGLSVAADRWDGSFGPGTPMAQAAPAHCVTCGFLVPLQGSLRQAFGICANEYSPADGRVVSLGYGCGGHSEAAVMPVPPRPAPPVLDELGADPLV